MIKRILVTLILALCVLSASYAEIKLKDLGNGKVEITFLFKDASPEMGVIGSFDNWTVPGEAMAKNADGLWEKTITATATDEMTYKFYSAGTWIQDDMAPDHKDDGYGGKNGLIVVADILSGVTPVSPMAVPTIGAAGGPAAAKTYNSKLLFGMYTIVGSRSLFSTQSVTDKTQKGLETDTTGLYGTSYWKIDGTLLPGVRTFINIKAFDGYKPVWAQDARGIVSPTLDKGLGSLAAGVLTNPINYFGAVNPTIDSLKTTVETPYVVWETAYQYAKPDDHTGALWKSLYQQNANNGYMRFDLGKGAKKLADATVEATFAPNMMTGYYGVFSWISFAVGDTKFEVQYDAKSAQASQFAKMLDKLYHQDYLVSVKTKVAGIDLYAQGLANQFSESAFQNESNLAGEVKAQWALPNDVFGIATSYRYTGDQATLLFGNNDEALGNKGSTRILGNLWSKPIDLLRLGIDSSLSLDNNFKAGQQKSYYAVYGKPWTEISLDKLMGRKSALSGYVKMNYALREGYQYIASQNRFNLGEVGAKFTLTDPIKDTMKGLEVNYGLNGWEDNADLKNRVFHTLIANMSFPKDLSVQTGLAYRVVRDYATTAIKDQNNAFGFSVGAAWRVPVSEIRNPQLYGAFVYNMDPYDGNTANLKLNDSVTDGGAAKSDGQAQLRIMMKWDF